MRKCLQKKMFGGENVFRIKCLEEKMFGGCLSRFGKNASRRRGGQDQNFGVDFHLHRFFLHIFIPLIYFLDEQKSGYGKRGEMSTFEELRKGEKTFLKRRAITLGGFRTLRGGERARSTCNPESTTTHLLRSSPTRVTSVKS